MDDLVRRQAAIDAVHKAGITEYDETLAIEEIERVPSTQPEHNPDDERKIADLHKMINYLYSRLKEQFIYVDYLLSRLKQQWIPVTERLPEEETDVIVCNANGDIQISRGSHSTEMKDHFIWYTTGWRFGKVIAWMPLPEPYFKQ